jgi:N-acetylglucosaminyl-diphospho-decaprenol L-rhamnosyltransferase
VIKITVSIVSHGHDCYIIDLVSQLAAFCESVGQVIITHNIASTMILNASDYPFEILIIENSVPKGFAANHNYAFDQAVGSYFCVLNPDIIFKEDPFKVLLCHLGGNGLGLVAPIVKNVQGYIQDNARFFPTPFSIFRKVMLGARDAVGHSASEVTYTDWLAGMFLLTPSRLFRQIGGFDSKFWLYYEDVDLSLRYWESGYYVGVCTRVEV